METNYFCTLRQSVPLKSTKNMLITDKPAPEALPAKAPSAFSANASNLVFSRIHVKQKEQGKRHALLQTGSDVLGIVPCLRSAGWRPPYHKAQQQRQHRHFWPSW